MTVNVTWFNEEKTLIHYDFEGRWTWEDLYKAIDDALALLNSVTHRVDIFLDTSNSVSVPNLNVAGLRRVASAPTATHPNTGIFVMVGLKSFIRIAFDIFARIYPRAIRQYRIAISIEDAINIVAKERATIA